MKRLLALALCLLILGSLITGCQIGDSVYIPTGGALDGDGSGEQTPTDGGNEINLTLAYYPDQSMNPLTSTDFTNRALFSLIYQGLFAVDRNYQAYPILCESYKVSKNNKTYTFYIADAWFSDGTKLTAEDVVASLNNAKKNAVYSGRFKQVKSISVGSDGGVVIKLNTAYENFPLLLDIPIVPKAQVGQERPLGTGPYLLDTTSLGGLRLKRVSNWWCGVQTVVNASSINLVEGESPAHIRDQFEFFDVSLVCADPGSDTYADFRSDFELWDCENGMFLYLGCNMSSEVFGNDTMRAALTFAIDRDYLVDQFYRGFARSATLPASPLSPYYSTGLASRYEYNAERFAQAVKDAGMEGKRVTLLVNKDDSLRLRAARAVEEMLEKGGLTVVTSELKTSAYKTALKNGSYDLYLGQTKLSANMDLSAFFATNGTLSAGGIQDPAIYNLCMQALANRGNYYTLHKLLADDGRICPILFRSYAIYASRGVVSGLTPSRDNIFFYHRGRTMADALVEAE